MTTTFENAKVGDRVWHTAMGWGEVARIREGDQYSILVKFENDECDSFTTTGYERYSDEYQSLFWNERKWADEVPRRPIPKPDLKVDDKVLVRDYEDDEWEPQHFASWSENGGIKCWSIGATSFTADGNKMTWNFYKLPEEK